MRCYTSGYPIAVCASYLYLIKAAYRSINPEARLFELSRRRVQPVPGEVWSVDFWVPCRMMWAVPTSEVDRIMINCDHIKLEWPNC